MPYVLCLLAALSISKDHFRCLHFHVTFLLCPLHCPGTKLSTWVEFLSPVCASEGQLAQGYHSFSPAPLCEGSPLQLEEHNSLPFAVAILSSVILRGRR